VGFLEDTLLDQPWADPALPSLVYEEGGQILGTLGANARRMRFRGEPIRAVVSAYFWSHPRVRNRGVGARLLQELLSGPQDLTLTDAATPAVRGMWEMLGGQTVHLGSFSYAWMLQPVRLSVELVLRHRLPRLAALARAVAVPMDALATRVPRARFSVEPSDAASEPLTPAAMVEHLAAVAGSCSLVADYDVPYLEWLFGHLRALDRRRLPWLGGVERGALVAELVTRRGRVLGWYVCYLRPSGLCRVLQIAAPKRGIPHVVRHLLARASHLGAIGVVGRLEPNVLSALEAGVGRCLVLPLGRMLVHARDPELLAAILRGDALLTRLDGEWWAA
jgi:hypothetical protein